MTYSTTCEYSGKGGCFKVEGGVCVCVCAGERGGGGRRVKVSVYLFPLKFSRLFSILPVT